MKTFISLVMLAALVLTPPLARAQQTLTADAEITAFRQLAEKIPLGSRIKLQTREGRRLTATLMAVSADGIVVKRESRLPEPAVSVGYSDLTRLHLDEKSGFSLGKAVGIGLAAGVGAILTLFAIAVSIDD
jgi:hypothetical protein